LAALAFGLAGALPALRPEDCGFGAATEGLRGGGASAAASIQPLAPLFRSRI
jgi:hypothetical protein